MVFYKRVPGHLKFKPCSFVHRDRTQLGPQRREASCNRKDFGDCNQHICYCLEEKDGLALQFSDLTKTFMLQNRLAARAVHSCKSPLVSLCVSEELSVVNSCLARPGWDEARLALFPVPAGESLCKEGIL